MLRLILIIRKALERKKNIKLELDAEIDNFYYYEKQSLMLMHWTPEQFDNTDYFELMRIMNAEKSETAEDLQPGNNLSDEELAKRHTSRQQLRKQSGLVDLSALVEKRKAELRKQQQEGG